MLGLDTVLLSDFAFLKKNIHICDLGAGSGALSLLLAGREKTAMIDGLEILPGACALAEENIRLNGLEDRIKIYCADLRFDSLPLNIGAYDMVITNPPYFAAGSGKQADGFRRVARSDETCPLSELIKTSKRLLKWGGYFAAVYRPERLSELLTTLKDNKIEPKRLRLVYKDLHSPASLALVEGKAGASEGLTVLPPLITKSESGGESDELKKIYRRDTPSSE